jgi:hypothetical protein
MCVCRAQFAHTNKKKIGFEFRFNYFVMLILALITVATAIVNDADHDRCASKTNCEECTSAMCVYCASTLKCTSNDGTWLGPGSSILGALQPSRYVNAGGCIDWRYGQCAVEGRLLVALVILGITVLLCCCCAWSFWALYHRCKRAPRPKRVRFDSLISGDDEDRRALLLQ